MPKKVTPNGHGPFMSKEDARDFLIKESDKDPTKEKVVDKVTCIIDSTKREVSIIPKNSIAYDHPPQSEHIRLSGRNSSGHLVKCGVSKAFN